MKKYIPHFIFFITVLLIAVMIDANNSQKRNATVFDHPLVEKYIEELIVTLISNFPTPIETATQLPATQPWAPGSITLVPLITATPFSPLTDLDMTETAWIIFDPSLR